MTTLGVATLTVTFWAEVKLPPLGLKVGVQPVFQAFALIVVVDETAMAVL